MNEARTPDAAAPFPAGDADLLSDDELEMVVGGLDRPRLPVSGTEGED